MGEHLRAPLWMMMHDLRCLEVEERHLVTDVREAVTATEDLQVKESGAFAAWPQVLGETLVMLLPLWRLSALSVGKGQDTLMRFVAGPPLNVSVQERRHLQRLIEVLLEENADFINIAMWFTSEPSAAELLCCPEVVEFLLPEPANADEFTQFRKEVLMHVHENAAAMHGHIVRLPPHVREAASTLWRRAAREVHLYLQQYLGIIGAFMDVQREVHTFVQNQLFVEVSVGLPPMTWLSPEAQTGVAQA